MTGVATQALIFLFCLGMVYGAMRDVLSFTIPNQVSYGLALLFVPFALLNLGWSTALLHLGLALLVFVICFVFWQLRWLGGGDVKFMSAAALWMGPRGLFIFMLLLTAFSALFVLLLRALRGRNDMVQASGWPQFVKTMVQKSQENAVPYGLPIALAALGTVLFVVPQLQAY